MVHLVGVLKKLVECHLHLVVLSLQDLFCRVAVELLVHLVVAWYAKGHQVAFIKCQLFSFPHRSCGTYRPNMMNFFGGCIDANF